jgi:hypothetical protein
MSALQLYGIEIIQDNQVPRSIIGIDSVQADSSISVENDFGSSGASWGMNQIHSISMDVAAKEENKLIGQYRELINIPEVDLCIEEIVQEAIIFPKDGENAIDIDLSNLDDKQYSVKVKKLMQEEFKTVYDLLHFNRKGHDIFKRWLVDSRINYYKLIDNDNLEDGIQGLTYIDPRKIKKVQESNRTIDPDTRALVINDYKEFFYYNENGIKNIDEEKKRSEGGSGVSALTAYKQSTTQPINILTRDSVAYAPSGINDSSGKMVVGYLHKVLKTANNLQLMEDSMLIYKLSRAPERRVFYIDTGNLPKGKAEQYVKGIADKYRTKVVYDAKSGEIKNDRKFNALTEDFWLPRSGGSKGTEISTLPGGSNSGDTEETEYFKDKLFDAMGVPKARFEEQNTMFSGGTQITRDEIRFSRLIERLRTSFNMLFEDILGTQLILKNIIDVEDWANIKNKITYKYAEDNYFKEAVALERMQLIATLMQQYDMLTGKWVSKEFVYKNVAMFTDDEIAEIKEQIASEEDTSVEKEIRSRQSELELANIDSQEELLKNPPPPEVPNIAAPQKPVAKAPPKQIKAESFDEFNMPSLTEDVISEMF